MPLLRLISLGLALLLLTAGIVRAESPQRGRLCITVGKVSVRETPSDSALQVRLLKAGQKVRAEFLDQGWATVFDAKEPKRSEPRAMGYARVTGLRPLDDPEPLQGTTLPGAPGRAPATTQGASVEVRRPDTEAGPEGRVAVKPFVRKGEPETAPRHPQAPSSAAPAAKPSAEIRVADRQLAVRAARDKDSEFKRLLRPGQRVRVDHQQDGWFAVFDPAEKSRDLAKAWGYGRDKYLVPEAEYAPPPAEGTDPVHKSKPGETEAVGYAVLERKAASRKAGGAVTLRVRLDQSRPPAADALRKIVREIWKAERKKNEDLQLEVLLTGMDAHALAYAVARFHDDGRIREFWWREVVLKPVQ